jgi:nucleoside-diphosphate-sugar epimerase
MKLLFGCGYLGARVARLWKAQGAAVTIVTRSAAKAAALQAEGYGVVVADVCDPASLAALPAAETILFAVGYDRQAAATGAARSIEEVYAGGVRNVLNAMRNAECGMRNDQHPHSALRTPNSAFVYISSTGVYGDADGEWVDESTPCRPLREGGRACLAAEQAIATHPLGARAAILRLAGIYGPDRIPRAESLRRGEPIDAPSDGFLNLIHVDDAARIVLDVERAAQAGRIALPRTYCVSDGRPPLRREYYGELARLLDAPPPKFVAPQAECRAMLRAAADKRISNSHLLADIEPQLHYPSYREGLAAITNQRASNT